MSISTSAATDPTQASTTDDSKKDLLQRSMDKHSPDGKDDVSVKPVFNVLNKNAEARDEAGRKAALDSSNRRKYKSPVDNNPYPSGEQCAVQNQQKINNRLRIVGGFVYDKYQCCLPPIYPPF